MMSFSSRITAICPISSATDSGLIDCVPNRALAAASCFQSSWNTRPRRIRRSLLDADFTVALGLPGATASVVNDAAHAPVDGGAVVVVVDPPPPPPPQATAHSALDTA